jgi:EAL domain-containing protein (putative c-di-GMP-specific phosphodiesterase class I)
VAVVAVRRLGAGLDSVVAQARALEQGRFVEITEPPTPELQRLAAGMNSMVRRLHQLFDGQANQLETLRRQAHADPLTGLSNRRHFVAQLERALVARGGDAASALAPRRGSLLIVRLRDLVAMNARVGRDAVDRLLASMGEVLLTYPERVDGAFAGRLNGTDLALYLPVNGVGRETADALRSTLGIVLTAVDPMAEVAIGGVDGLATGGVSEALAAADEALAGAEAADDAAPLVVEGVEETPLGESEWRQRIANALASGRVRLAEFAVIDASGRILHLECPLRIQLAPDGPFDAAARWLPMAARGRLTQNVDLAAVGLALEAIALDGQPRCVHVAAASLADSGFAQALARLLAESPGAAQQLMLEVGEAVSAHSRRWRDAAERWRPFGVRLGLENAGSSLRTLVDARGWGLDYLKIDGRFLRGLAHDPALAGYARQVVAAARSIGVPVYAEGITDAQDLLQLWELGFDGATGPAIVTDG